MGKPQGLSEPRGDPTPCLEAGVGRRGRVSLVKKGSKGDPGRGRHVGKGLEVESKMSVRPFLPVVCQGEDCWGGQRVSHKTFTGCLESDGEPWNVPSQSDCLIHAWASTCLAQFPEAARHPWLESRQTGSHPTSPSWLHRHHSLSEQLSSMPPSPTCST